MDLYSKAKQSFDLNDIVLTFFSLLLLLFIFGCGDSASNGKTACDLGSSTGICNEYSGSSAGASAAACAEVNSGKLTTSCSTSNLKGKCTTTSNGTTQTSYVYTTGSMASSYPTPNCTGTGYTWN